MIGAGGGQGTDQGRRPAQGGEASLLSVLSLVLLLLVVVVVVLVVVVVVVVVQ